MKIAKLNWPVKEVAEPVQISHNDRALIVYINEDHQLTVEISGPVKIETGHPSNIMQITLDSDQ